MKFDVVIFSGSNCDFEANNTNGGLVFESILQYCGVTA